jgi:GTPase SAR1 family protein
MKKFKIFVIGYSECGKSTFSQALCERLSVQYIGASEWTRKFNVTKDRNPAYRETVTNLARKALLENPRVCIDYISSSLSAIKEPVIVEGLRNPFDFMNLYDPANDYVIHLEPENAIPINRFDDGIDVIIDFLGYMNENHLFDDVGHFYREYGHELSETLDLVKRYSFNSVTGKLERIE